MDTYQGLATQLALATRDLENKAAHKTIVKALKERGVPADRRCAVRELTWLNRLALKKKRPDLGRAVVASDKARTANRPRQRLPGAP